MQNGDMKIINNLFKRIWGRSYPCKNIEVEQLIHGRLGSHSQAEWTTPEHFAHNNYQRSHLPQLIIKASGWKARLLALIFLPKRPWEPIEK